MNRLDAVVLVFALLAGTGGWRLGFIGKLTGWIGFIVGVFIASKLAPELLGRAPDPGPADLMKTLLLMVVGATLGETIGRFVGRRLRPDGEHRGLARLDRGLGAFAAVALLGVSVWMVVPAMSQIRGWPSEVARGSIVARSALRYLGEPPDLLDGVGESLGGANLGSLLEGLGSAPSAPPVPATGSVSAEVLATVRRSVVKVSGPACGLTLTGSGFVLAEGLVVTNAHVVAGTESLTVATDDGEEHDGTLVRFDSEQDVAVVAVPDLGRPPLPLVSAAAGDVGAVLGYPGGGPLDVQPYEVGGTTTASSKDIYDRRTVLRQVMVIGSRIGPGDSGGPLVDPQGRVAGVAFGVAPTSPDTAYAIPTSVLPSPGGVDADTRVSSGECRV